MHVLYLFPAGHFYAPNNHKWFRLLAKMTTLRCSVILPDCDPVLKEKFISEYGQRFEVIYFKTVDEILALNWWQKWRYVQSIASSIDRLQPDIIHLHAAFNSYMIYPLLFLKIKPKIIYNIWGSDFNLGYFNNRKRRLLIRWLVRHASLVWTNWYALRDAARTEFPQYKNKIQTILWGADRYLFEPVTVEARQKVERLFSKKTAYTMLYVRGFVPNSNQKALIEALRLLPEELDYQLILHYPAKESAYLSELKNLCAKYNLQERVLFSHTRLNAEEMKALFERADLTFSLTEREQFSRTIFEAILSGTHLILNNIAPYGYLVNKFKFKIPLVDVHDGQALAVQIENAIRNPNPPDWREEIEKIKKMFDFEAKGPLYAEIYRALADGQSLPSSVTHES